MTRARRSALALGALLGLALAVRLAGLEWGLPRCYHPDEWIYSWNAARMIEERELRIAHGVEERRYVNPTGFIYATALASLPLNAWENHGQKSPSPTNEAFAHYLEHRGDWHLVARALSALFGVLAVFAVFRAGEMLERVGASRGTAVLAAGLLALSPLHVRDSHFGTNDVAASALVALGVLALLRYGARPTTGGAALVGAALGAAIATKYNAGLLVLPALATFGAVVLGRARDSHDLKLDLGAAVATLLATFLVLCPAPVIDARVFWAGFHYQASLSSRPYEGQEPIPSWWFHARTLAIALGPVGLAATLLGAWRLGVRRAGLAVTTYPLVHLALFASMPFAFARVDVPALPLLALLAGTGAAWVFERLRLGVGARQTWGVTFFMLLLVPPALFTVRIDSLLRERDTRMDGEAWLKAHLPERPLVAFDPEARRGLMPLGADGNIDPALPGAVKLDHMDGPGVVDQLLEANVQYVALISGDEDEPLPPQAHAFMKELVARSEPKLVIDGGVNGEHVRYSSEERYAPYEHVFERERPGPPVRIYELTR